MRCVIQFIHCGRHGYYPIATWTYGRTVLPHSAEVKYGCITCLDQ